MVLVAKGDVDDLYYIFMVVLIIGKFDDWWFVAMVLVIAVIVE
jgi:hypothetical protein